MRLQTISNSDPVPVRGRVDINLKLQGDLPALRIKAYVIDKLIDPIPTTAFCAPWPELTKLDLADPSFYQPRAVNLLLGSDVIPLILKPGVKIPTAGTPGALSTTLGWVLFGPYDPHLRVKKHVTFSPNTCFTNLRCPEIPGTITTDARTTISPHPAATVSSAVDSLTLHPIIPLSDSNTPTESETDTPRFEPIILSPTQDATSE